MHEQISVTNPTGSGHLSGEDGTLERQNYKSKKRHLEMVIFYV